MSDQVDRNENLIEVVRHNGDFSRHYGPWLGALLYWLSMKAARPRSLWWSGMIALVTGIAVWLQGHRLPTFIASWFG